MSCKFAITGSNQGSQFSLPKLVSVATSSPVGLALAGAAEVVGAVVGATLLFVACVIADDAVVVPAGAPHAMSRDIINRVKNIGKIIRYKLLAIF